MHETYVAAPGRRREIGSAPLGFAPLDVLLCAPRNAGLFASLVTRELTVRYRGSMLGLLWLVGAPIAMMATYGFVFLGVLGIRHQGQGAGESLVALWACMAAWQYLAEAVSRSCTVVADNAALVKRSAVPLVLLPLSAALTPLAGLAISWILVAVASSALVGPPGLSWLLLPAAAVPLVLLAVAIGYAAAVVGTFVRDVRHALPIAMNCAMLVSPVLYPLSAVGGRMASVVSFNPAAPVLDAVRRAVTGSSADHGASLALVALGAWLAAALAYRVFERAAPEFADVL